MIFVNWILGPQLLGVIFLLAGYIQKCFPPKEINSLYGYRTARSMQDQQHWDEGNKYSTQLMLNCGWVLLVAGIMLSIALNLFDIDPKLKAWMQVAVVVAGSVVVVMVLFTKTEKHLKDTFNDI
ncbi:SdpI family protein [Mucilaginibacter lutimaris]|uniref:SdpI family protein n=1 Tax=Mucilaginibacter lutimaris TaxID=931629 RepID=A0ABW2ZJD4_9SPHI